MPQTIVGSFANPEVVSDVVREMEAAGFPRNEIRSVTEPHTFDVMGVMSFPRLDFETDLARALIRIGASKSQSQAYLKSLRSGGAMVFATGTEGNLLEAALIMNRYGAAKLDMADGPTPSLPTAAAPTMAPADQQSDAARVFVW